MKRFLPLSLALIILFSLSACHKNSTAPTVQAEIVGKWALQKQSYVEYFNDVKQVDTVCIASDTISAYVQFNADKSFKSEGLFFSKNPDASFSDETNVTGTYTVTNSALTVSKTMAGLIFFPATFTTDNFLPVPTITNVLHTSKLTYITSNTLGIHTEDSYTSTVNSVSTNVKEVYDFYYTK